MSFKPSSHPCLGNLLGDLAAWTLFFGFEAAQAVVLIICAAFILLLTVLFLACQSGLSLVASGLFHARRLDGSCNSCLPLVASEPFPERYQGLRNRKVKVYAIHKTRSADYFHSVH